MDMVAPNRQSEFPFALRACGAADQPAILELLRLTVGETATSRKTEEFWRWKHTLNPCGASFAVCAHDDAKDVVVGLRAMMRWEFRDPAGDRWAAVRPVDTATHPDYQRRGIFSALTRYSLAELSTQGVPFIFNTPNQNSLPGYLKMGWSVVARWPLFARPCHALSAPSTILRATFTGRPARPHDSVGSSLPWGQFCSAYGDEVAEVIAANEAARTAVGYRTARDSAYLDWRYGGHPDIAYEVYPHTERGRLAGFVIGRSGQNQRGWRSFVITELVAREPSVRAVRGVLRAALRGMPHLYAVAHFSVGTLERRALRQLGFVRLRTRGYTFAARSLTNPRLNPLLASSWDVTLGDLEIF